MTFDDDHQSSQLLYVHVKRRLVEAGPNLDLILADINSKVDDRQAIILESGQFLRNHLEPSWIVFEHFDDYSSSPVDHHVRDWKGSVRSYFQQLWHLDSPYQYSEDRHDYNQFAVSVRVPVSYLELDE